MVLMAGCTGAINGAQYQSLAPQFDLFRFFDGAVRAWGIVQDRDGNVIQRFTVDIDGHIAGDTLTLDEHFQYQVGEGPEQRIWEIARTSEGSYTGSAGDILGSASGQSYGNAFQWRYQMDLPVDDTTYVVDFDDWFWALDERTLMNRSAIRKFGIVFAEVTIFMQRQSP